MQQPEISIHPLIGRLRFFVHILTYRGNIRQIDTLIRSRNVVKIKCVTTLILVGAFETIEPFQGVHFCTQGVKSNERVCRTHPCWITILLIGRKMVRVLLSLLRYVFVPQVVATVSNKSLTYQLLTHYMLYHPHQFLLD